MRNVVSKFIGKNEKEFIDKLDVIVEKISTFNI